MRNNNLINVKLPFPGRGDKTVWIYVPKTDSNKKLPVVYMTDGQNLFDDDATPYGCWGVIPAVENEQKNGFDGAVIVGIDNSDKYRDSELAPKQIGEIQHREMLNDIFTPQGEIFDNFLMNTVIPYVESHCNVRTDRDGVAVCGSSMGGLQAFFEGIEHPEKFGFVGALSPAFALYLEDDWRNYLLSKMKDDMPYVYIYCGAGDELELQLYNSVEMMYDLLPETGYPYEKLNEIILLEKKHNEEAWREIFPDVLHTFLSGKFAL